MLYWILGIAGFLLLNATIMTYICYYKTFMGYKEKQTEEYPIPPGPVYAPWRETMVAWMKEVRALPNREYCIESFDGLKLYGKYYEYTPGAPIELMMHGYRGRAERDLCGGVQRSFALGRSALVIDQRACGKSQGRTITFGIKEHRDCLSWVDFMIREFGPDVKIILTGISMGASTVLMAAGQALPSNVIGVLADCGFTSAKDIIQQVTRNMKLPPKLTYPFIKLGARLFGGFDPDAYSAIEAVKNCKIPVIFYHGESDDFVPCQMSKDNFDACTSEKMLVTIPGAGHGLCYLVDPDRYLQTLGEFFSPYL